ncbi:substrate-binding domain-containing protein [Actinomycetes bacterium KLBMP 9797]
MADQGAVPAGAPVDMARRRRGRPRDAGKDAAIHAATVALLRESGYASLTMDQVAHRTPVSKASLYLRWRDKGSLLADTLRQQASAVPAVPDTGSLADDMRAFLRALWGPGSEILSTLAAVSGEIHTNAPLRAACQRGVIGTLTERLRTIVRRAISRGELPSDADVELLAWLPLALIEHSRRGHDQDHGEDEGRGQGRRFDDAVIERIVRQFLNPSSAGGPAAGVGIAPVPTAGRPVAAQGGGRRRGGLTVAAIARLAGVSAPTVSKVLNGRAGVAAETRHRVAALLREHEYRRPETVVQAPCVEVVFFGMQSNLAVRIMRGVEQVASEPRLAVGFVDVLRQRSAGRSWTDDMLARRPTGVIAVNSAFTSEHHALLRPSGIPLVALEPAAQLPPGIPSVEAANWNGAVTATRHLLGLGHRRIAVISGPSELLWARARLDGARATLEAAGVPLEEPLVRIGSYAFEDGLRLAGELLGLPERPTAVLCGDDLQALGVYEAARRAGLRIPYDLSVVGFNEIPNTNWCGPPMTTVRPPLTEMGATAARLVLAQAAGETLVQARIELATSLVVRESTAPPPRW